MAEPVKHSRLLTFSGVVIVVGALYLAREVLIPLALAALISFLLAPLAARIERLVGRIAAVVLVLVLACGILGGLGYLVVGQATELAEMLPQYRENIASKLTSLPGRSLEKATDAIKNIEADLKAKQDQEKDQQPEEGPAGPLPREGGGVAASGSGSGRPGADRSLDRPEPVPVEVVEPQPTSIEIIGGAFAPLLGPLGTAGMVIVLVAFMLLAREDLRDRLIRLMGRTRIHITTQAIDDAGTRVSRYLLMQTVINCIHGCAVGLGLFFLDVPSFLLWGLLSAALRFIPYLGPVVCDVMPILLSLAVFPGWEQPLFVLGYLVLLELVSNNVLEPWLYGTSAGVSSFAIILAAIFWTWLWGPIGLLLATPLTVCIVVIGKHIPQLQFINIMLSDEPVLEPPARLYQRLLAMDGSEAKKIVERSRADGRSLLAAYDAVVLPALLLFERDRRLGHFNDEQVAAVYRGLRDVVEDLGETAAADEKQGKGPAVDEPAVDEPAGAEATAEGGAEPPVVLPHDFVVVVVPLQDAADELSAEMLVQATRAAGATCEAVSVAALTAEMVDVVDEYRPDAVCLSVLPPVSLHARHVCRRLLTRFPDLRLVVGLWAGTTPIEKERERLGCGSRARVVSTLHAALDELALAVQVRDGGNARAADTATSGVG